MDPNEALRQLRAWAQEVIDLDELTGEHEAAERFQALDQWMSRGGFWPTSSDIVDEAAPEVTA